MILYIIILEPVCPLFLGLNPQKEGPFHSKQGSFGSLISSKRTQKPASSLALSGIGTMWRREPRFLAPEIYHSG